MGELDSAGTGATKALSVVIPCFNEASNMEVLYRRVTSVCRAAAGGHYELIFVNDGSRDTTWEKISALCETDAHVVGADLSRNFGHQLALSAGLSICCGDRIFILDADLQDPPELLGAMMRLMDDGADVVYGKRRVREGESGFKKLSAKIFYRTLNALSDVSIPMDTGDFRLINRRVLEGLLQMPEQARFIRGMISWIGFNQVPLEYDRNERLSGETKYPFSKMMRLAVDAIVSFSIRPLRLTIYSSIISGLVGLSLVAYVLGSWLSGDTVPGWASATTFVLILGSLQLLCLGILGEYVGRIYGEVKRRPLFLIKNVKTSAVTEQRTHTPSAPQGPIDPTRAPGTLSRSLTR